MPTGVTVVVMKTALAAATRFTYCIFLATRHDYKQLSRYGCARGPQCLSAGITKKTRHGLDLGRRARARIPHAPTAADFHRFLSPSSFFPRFHDAHAVMQPDPMRFGFLLVVFPFIATGVPPSPPNWQQCNVHYTLDTILCVLLRWGRIISRRASPWGVAGRGHGTPSCFFPMFAYYGINFVNIFRTISFYLMTDNLNIL